MTNTTAIYVSVLVIIFLAGMLLGSTVKRMPVKRNDESKK